MSPAARKRVSRAARVAIPVLILGVILLAVGTTAFVQVSSQPWFCGSCHIMKPYHDSWTKSNHRNVACIKCHIAPGVKAEAMTKVQAANMVVKYFTGTATTRPWAKIEDASCLRSGCHSTRLIEGEVDYKGVRFDHTKHLGQVRRGIQLHCTSCHSQIVQGSHIAVTENTCVLCHFKGRPQAKPLATCTGCHPSPPRVTSKEGYVVDHPQYVKDRIDCLSCHNTVTQGSGDADQARCVSCHNETAKLAKFNDSQMLHKTHVGGENIACVQCHTGIDHRIVAISATVELDCKSCHKNTHLAQQKLYAGIGGHEVTRDPSSMYQARVSCVGCHNDSKAKPGHDTISVANESACLSCHGVRFANMLPRWQKDMDRKLATVEPIVAAAQEAAGGLPIRQRHVADSLLGLAADNLAMVKAGKGVHNIAYADQLIRGALTLVKDANKQARLDYRAPDVNLGPPISDNECLQCHTGIDQQRGSFGGKAFDHSPHISRGAVQCTSCHTSLEDHGKTTLKSAASCNECHHQQVPSGGANCATCHKGAAGAPADTFRIANRAFNHAPHLTAKVQCSACHTAPAMNASAINCDGCHHSPERAKPSACASCHKAGPGGAPADTLHEAKGDFTHKPHVVSAKLLCSQCHTAPAMTARTLNCDNCHDNHHTPAVACVSCHKTGTIDKHKVTNHVLCGQCHKTVPAVNRWSRQVCTACHTAQVNHKPGKACESCHTVPAMARAKAADVPKPK